MQEFVTHSRKETVALGREFAKTLPAGALIAFTGGLGAGKTAFCQGIAEGLGCTDPVSSPKTIWPPPGSMTIWTWALWLPVSGARTAPSCWRSRIPSGSTLSVWTRTQEKSQ